MHKSNFGIILRQFILKNQKIVILDEDLGKIECLWNKKTEKKIINGVYIEYSIEKWREFYKISEVNILLLPIHKNYESFLFFNLVLDFINFFTPFENRSSEIFDLLKKFYINKLDLKNNFLKKLFLCHILGKLGIYPNDLLSKNNDALNFKLICSAFDNCVKIEDNAKVNAYLNKWLSECINTYPLLYRLKTIKFLKELEIHE